MLRPSFPRLIGQLLRLRAGPQDFPYSSALFRRVAVVALAVDALAAHGLEPEGGSLWRIAGMFLIGLALPWALLAWRGRPERYVQTMTALLGSGLVFSLMFLPLALWLLSRGLVRVDAAPDPAQALAAWLILALVAWKVLVTAHVWRSALDWPMAAGIGLSLLLFVLEFVLDQWLFGAPVA